MTPDPASAAAAPAEFDPERLRAWLAREVPGVGDGPMALARIGGGQSNPTFFCDFAGRRLVVRKQPPGPLLPSAHAVDREYRILRALRGTAVPVPEAIAFCDDRAVVGTPFYVMDRLDGRVLPTLAMPEVAREHRRAHVLAMARTLAALHSVDWRAVGLADYGRPGNYFERQVARWSAQWRASDPEPRADVERLIGWLGANVPPSDATTIAHGDFRLGNLMFHPDPARAEVVGVLDWELSTLGHPLADVAYCASPWQMAPDDYHGLRGLDLEALGLPSMREFVDAYRDAGGSPEPLRPFHLAFSMFRFAAILAGVAARARAGNAAAADAAQVGAKAQTFVRRAIEIAEHGLDG